MKAIRMTAREQEAIDHVRDRIEVDGTHSITGCPRFCRMMCEYGPEIKQLKTDGRWPDDTPT